MSDFLLLAFILLCAGIIAVPIATRLKLGSVLGFRNLYKYAYIASNA